MQHALGRRRRGRQRARAERWRIRVRLWLERRLEASLRERLPVDAREEGMSLDLIDAPAGAA